MNINIDKKVASIAIISLLVGGAIGGAIGFSASHEEGRGGDRNEMGYKNGGMNQQYDNQADGKTADEKGGTPNSDEQTPNASSTTSVNASTTIKTR